MMGMDARGITHRSIDNIAHKNLQILETIYVEKVLFIKMMLSWVQWLMSVVPAIEEVKIRRTAV
jgi:hypothetical protein